MMVIGNKYGKGFRKLFTWSKWVPQIFLFAIRVLQTEKGWETLSKDSFTDSASLDLRK
jgi:hypothetical protein